MFHGMPSEKHLNPLGGVHGGWAATLSIRRSAARSRRCLQKGEAYDHSRIQSEPHPADHAETGEVVCEGRIVNRGRTLAVSEATLKDRDGKLLAFGTETCSIFPVANLAHADIKHLIEAD